jgi:hypothetical protein
MNSRDLIGVPKFIMNRFNSINSFVWEALFPEQRIVRLLSNLPTKKQRSLRIRELKKINQEAALAYFIFDVRRFFNAGSNAARNAVDIFSELGVNGFYIGASLFKDRNENVTMGDNLAKKLLASITDKELRDLISNSASASRIIDYYKIYIDDRYGR